MTIEGPPGVSKNLHYIFRICKSDPPGVLKFLHYIFTSGICCVPLPCFLCPLTALSDVMAAGGTRIRVTHKLLDDLYRTTSVSQPSSKCAAEYVDRSFFFQDSGLTTDPVRDGLIARLTDALGLSLIMPFRHKQCWMMVFPAP